MFQFLKILQKPITLSLFIIQLECADGVRLWENNRDLLEDIIEKFLYGIIKNKKELIPPRKWNYHYDCIAAPWLLFPEANFLKFSNPFKEKKDNPKEYNIFCNQMLHYWCLRLIEIYPKYNAKKIAYCIGKSDFYYIPDSKLMVFGTLIEKLDAHFENKSKHYDW